MFGFDCIKFFLKSCSKTVNTGHIVLAFIMCYQYFVIVELLFIVKYTTRTAAFTNTLAGAYPGISKGISNDRTGVWGHSRQMLMNQSSYNLHDNYI